MAVDVVDVLVAALPLSVGTSMTFVNVKELVDVAGELVTFEVLPELLVSCVAEDVFETLGS